MPHDHIKLAQSPSGEIGPLCHSCSKSLTFGEAIPHGKYYLCWECYIEITGSKPAAIPDSKAQPFYRDGSESR